MKKMKLLIVLIATNFLVLHGLARENSTFDPLPPFKRHEIGIAWGAFPTAGVWAGNVSFRVQGKETTGTRYPTLTNRYPWFAHGDFKSWTVQNGISEYYHMQHYGSLTFNYQYHFSKKHSIGFDVSWLGRYISNYTSKSDMRETVNAKGWENFFTLCANYRFTYFNRNNISLYTALHFGVALGVIERKLLFSEEPATYFVTALQITGLGIEAGYPHAFISELGFGAQGLIKIGYRYKFQ